MSNTIIGIENILKRAFMFCEDSDWEKANEYFERVLDNDPECGDAYLGKLMVDLKLPKRNMLGKQKDSFNDNANYLKLIKYASDELKEEVKTYEEMIKHNKYSLVISDVENSYNVESEKYNLFTLKKGIIELSDISDYADASEKIEFYKEQIYLAAMENSNKEIKNPKEAYENYKQTKELLEIVGEYKDSSSLLEACNKKIEKLRTKVFITIAAIVAVCIVLIAIVASLPSKLTTAEIREEAESSIRTRVLTEIMLSYDCVAPEVTVTRTKDITDSSGEDENDVIVYEIYGTTSCKDNYGNLYTGTFEGEVKVTGISTAKTIDDLKCGTYDVNVSTPKR